MGSVGPGSMGPSAFSGSQVESLPGPGSRSVGSGPIGESDHRSKSGLLASDPVIINCRRHPTESEVRSSDFDQEDVLRRV